MRAVVPSWSRGRGFLGPESPTDPGDQYEERQGWEGEASVLSAPTGLLDEEGC